MQMPAMVSLSPSRIFLFFFFPTLLLLIITHDAIAQPPFLSHACLNGKGNYTANRSAYHRNLHLLLSSLEAPQNGNGYGFYISSYGTGQNTYHDDRVYAMGLCRGDVAADVCRSCLDDSRHALTRLCPNQTEAIGWYDNCMLRYSNRTIYGTMETMPAFYMYNTQDLSSWNRKEFFHKFNKLMKNLTSEAAAGGSLRKFAIGNTSVPISDQIIYALAQCTPDLSHRQCNDCLVGAFQELINCCWPKVGGRFVRASCSLRYELYLFYEPTVVAPPLPTQISPPQPFLSSSATVMAPPLPTPISLPPPSFSSSVTFKFVKDLILLTVKLFE